MLNRKKNESINHWNQSLTRTAAQFDSLGTASTGLRNSPNFSFQKHMPLCPAKGINRLGPLSHD